MKKISFLAIVLFFGLIVVWGCSKKDDKTTDDTSTITTNNNNNNNTQLCPTCKFRAKEDGVEFASNAFAVVLKTQYSSTFIIKAPSFKSTLDTLQLFFHPDSIKVGTYLFSDISEYAFNASKYTSASYWSTPKLSLFMTSIVSKSNSTLKITKYDVTNKLISGTFYVTLYGNGSSDKVVFTEGTFTDVKW